MTVTTPGTEGESPHEGESPRPRSADATRDATSLFGSRVGSDLCVECGATLALDQRYCVECGTRRGKPRFNLQSPSPAEAAVTPAEPNRRRRSTWSPSATLVAGIATLLLALGVGVIIGESGSNTSKGADGIHVVVNGGGSSGGTASTPASSGTASSSTPSSSSGSKAKTKTKASTKVGKKTHAAAVAKNAPAASSGVSKAVTKTPTVKPGASCKAGTTGCAGGKVGTFFGSG